MRTLVPVLALALAACRQPPPTVTLKQPDRAPVRVAVVSWPAHRCEFPGEDVPEPPEVKVYVPPSGSHASDGLGRVYVTMRNLEDFLGYNRLIREELRATRACLKKFAAIVEGGW